MPIRKKGIKSLRQSIKRQKVNKTLLSNLRNQIKKLKTLIAEKRFDEAKALFSTTLIKKLDKAAKKGLLHKKTAARKKSRLSKKIAAIV